MDTFANLVFVQNTNIPTYQLAEMSWTNGYGILVNEEPLSIYPQFPTAKYMVSCIFNNNLTTDIVISGKLEALCTPDEVTMVMEALQSL